MEYPVTTDTRPVLLEVRDLKTHFFLDEGTVRAVDGASFSIRRGQTIGVVGESGCGKSITARSILRIVRPPGKIVEGKITYYRPLGSDGTDKGPHVDAVDLTALDSKGPEMQKIRGGEISMVFQEPMTSLSPVHTIGNQIMENFSLHFSTSKGDARKATIEMLN